MGGEQFVSRYELACRLRDHFGLSKAQAPLVKVTRADTPEVAWTRPRRLELDCSPSCRRLKPDLKRWRSNSSSCVFSRRRLNRMYLGRAHVIYKDDRRRRDSQRIVSKPAWWRPELTCGGRGTRFEAVRKRLFHRPSSRSGDLGQHITANPKVCGGRPTFKGTRVIVWQVLDQVAEGMPWEQICWSWRGKDIPRSHR